MAYGPTAAQSASWAASSKAWDKKYKDWGGWVGGAPKTTSSYGKPTAPKIYGYLGGRPVYQPRHGLSRGSAAGTKPRFGTMGTLTPQQQKILSGLMGGKAEKYSPVAPRAGAGGWRGGMPTYASMPLEGSAERQATLGRMMATSPGEEAAAIQAMSAPAMRQFREEVLPGIRGEQAATGTTWSTMRAGEESKAGAGLAENLAAMGEQLRMQRRTQAMTAAGLGREEAAAPTQFGLQRYGMEMPAYMQAQQIGMQPAMQAQQLTSQARRSREAMLAQLLGIPMMGVYNY